MSRKSKTYSLTKEQERRAKTIIQNVNSYSSPSELVDSWEAAPSNLSYDQFEEKRNVKVPVERIQGTDKHNINRLVNSRLESIVRLLLEGRFEKRRQKRGVPHYICVNGNDYFVDSDGNHRTIAFKAIGIDNIYADVTRLY